MSKINPQKENGHRQIANDVMEALIKAKLSGAEYQLTLFVIHKTWGWQKPFDKISYSQIIKATNLTRPGAINTLKKLEKKHILVVDRKVVNGSLPINNYLFNKHYDTWVGQSGKQIFTTLDINELKLVNKQNETGKQMERKVVNGSLHTKESITKDTSTKKKHIVRTKKGPNPDIRKFIDSFCETHKEKLGEKYMVQGAKDGNLVKTMLGAYALNKLIKLKDKYFDSDDAWITEKGYSIGMFYSQVSKLLTGGAKKPQEEMENEGTFKR